MKPEINSYEDYKREYDKSISLPEEFWSEKANALIWKQKWEKVLEWNFKNPLNRWFIGGKLNISENCLDRHLERSGNKNAFIWVPNNPNEKPIEISYSDLHKRVCRFANVLKENGVKKGDAVCIYLPMVPELPVAMLACARIGAVHSVVYAGFSSESLASRINDAEARILITADGGFRGKKTVLLKEIADVALQSCPTIAQVILVQRTGEKVPFNDDRDVWWHELESKASNTCPVKELDSEDPAFILYTSGSTGKPKGVVHACGGYMVYVDYTFRNIFQCGEDEVYWCTADIGWITGHSYLVYGPLMSGITSVMFEGIPTFPDASRWWQIVDEHKVNIFYTSPTAIRTLETFGTDPITSSSLESLRVLGTVGEPINESAWRWYHKNIGKENCPILDTWWQTETGGIMISPLIPVKDQKPGFAMFPLPGAVPVIVNEKGEEQEGNDVEGYLCFSKPWPGMMQTVFNNPERFRKTYFGTYPGMYFTEDSCRRDKDGHYRITGRTDDLIKVAGHLLGTAEIENTINTHDAVIESAVIGIPHTIKGHAIEAFVSTGKEISDSDQLSAELIELVSKKIGPIAKPERIHFVKELPKTRSGKITRRVLRKIAEGETSDFGDTSTMINPEVIDEIINNLIAEVKR